MDFFVNELKSFIKGKKERGPVGNDGEKKKLAGKLSRLRCWPGGGGLLYGQSWC